MAGTDGYSNPVNQHRFTIGERSPSLVVIKSVAQLRDEDPGSLPVLANHIDPESLDKIISRTNRGIVRFKYAGFDIEVYSSGELLIFGTARS